MQKINYFLTGFIALLFSSCKLCYLTNPSCLLAPGATTNVKKNKYYEKHFIKTDTILSTKFIYEQIDTLTNNNYRYNNHSFLFYDNGLVLEEDYNTNNTSKDTVYTFTKELKNACCHGWSIGTYKVSNDTVFFAAKAGYQNEWTYYTAKIYVDKLSIFIIEQGKRKDKVALDYRKNAHKIVLKTIRVDLTTTDNIAFAIAWLDIGAIGCKLSRPEIGCLQNNQNGP